MNKSSKKHDGSENLRADALSLHLWRYAVKAENEHAEAVLCSSGLFAVVSTFGNYSYAWRDLPDGDIRGFLTTARADYIAGKLGDGRIEYNAARTLARVKEAISIADAAEELARIEVAHNNLSSPEEFHCWAKDQVVLDDTSELAVYWWPRDLVRFYEVLLPPLREAIRADLDAAKDGAKLESTHSKGGAQ